MKWALLAVFVGILLYTYLCSTEYFTDTEFINVKRPCKCGGLVCPSECSAWESKIGALAPTGYVTADYITVLAAFYDSVYVPAASKPTEAQVNTFLASSAGTVAGVDIPSMKRIIMDGFHINSATTAAQNEEASMKFKPSGENLEPEMGRDEFRIRMEDAYFGANPSPSTRFSEGDYAPVSQSKPRNPGQWEDGSMMWKGPRPASVCPCAENIM